MSAKAAPVSRSSGRSSLALVKRRHSELIVQLFLLRIGENLIGLSDLLEFLLGLCVSRIGIRMIFFRQFPVCTLYLFIVSSSGQPQNLVIIPFHREAASFL